MQTKTIKFYIHLGVSKHSYLFKKEIGHKLDTVFLHTMLVNGKSCYYFSYHLPTSLYVLGTPLSVLNRLSHSYHKNGPPVCALHVFEAKTA